MALDHTALRRFDTSSWADWLIPAAAATVWAIALASAGSVATERSLVFIGAPVVMLSGLHARLTGYLHADARAHLLPRPIPPSAHFGAAFARHLRGQSAMLAVFGLALVLCGAARAGGFDRAWVGLCGDAVWLAAMASLLERVVPAAAAYLGRRFPKDSPVTNLQRSLGGGWTLPEAVIHLYAPAFGVGAAALLAMPGQLWLDQTIDGGPTPPWLLFASAAAPLAAIVAFVIAPRVYAAGMFGSVPFVVEATRTLAGPPTPEKTPRVALAFRDPVLRLLVLQFWRQTPLPTFRLLALASALGWIALRPDPPAATHAALVAAVAALWLVPAAGVAQGRPARARLLGALPLPFTQRAGTHSAAAGLLFAPAAVAIAFVAIRWVGVY